MTLFCFGFRVVYITVREQNLKNMITDISGILVGNAHDKKTKTGVTVILPETPVLASVDVRGGGTGTRELSALSADGSINHAHAIVLSGGSVYGLAAADSVCVELGHKRIGYEVAPVPVPVSPIVPAAILFDNANGGDKKWGDTPPFATLGKKAFDNASSEFELGRAGAGYGAGAGIYTGGLGSASERVGDITISALIAANPIGSPYLPGTDCFFVWYLEQNNEFGGKRPPVNYQYKQAKDTKLEFLKKAGGATIIGVVATNAKLSHAELRRVNMMATNGIAMAVQPAHTPLDGDTIFAISTEEAEISESRNIVLAEIGAAASRCVARAVAKAVYLANQ